MSVKKYLNAVEGDFLETKESIIFDVKGFCHPPDKIIAFARYVPNVKGKIKRRSNGLRYSKIYDLNERFSYLEKNYPEYVYFDPVFNRKMQGARINHIKKIYYPTKKLKQLFLKEHSLNPLEKKCVEFSKEIMDHSSLKLDDMGVSGSILVDLYREKSDIDLIVYGEKQGKEVYEELKSRFTENICFYNLREITKLVKSKYTVPAEILKRIAEVEKRKLFQGKYKGSHYFIRFIASRKKEKYGEKKYEVIGEAIVQATVKNAEKSLFTPCVYELEETNVLSLKDAAEKKVYFVPSEIVSFRGRYCGLAVEGERILACGWIEKVKEKGRENFRLLLERNNHYLVLTS